MTNPTNQEAAELDEQKITQGELQRLFGDTIPIEAVNLFWNAPGDWTTSRIRAELRKLASHAEPDQDVEDLWALLAAWDGVTHSRSEWAEDFERAKAVWVTILDRVRHEERAEMQKAVDHYAGLYAERCGAVLKAKADGAHEERVAVCKWLPNAGTRVVDKAMVSLADSPWDIAWALKCAIERNEHHTNPLVHSNTETDG